MRDLRRYIELIKSGEVVAFPTETVYGLGADAWNPSAIKKIFRLKGRPADNPLIVHISDTEQLEDFAADIPDSAKKLMASFWPGPLTMVLKKKPEVLDIITAGLDTVAVRMPDDELALAFISKTGPLVAPSANKSGRPSPTKAEHVLKDLGSNFPVIDGGATQVGLESTVLDLTSEIPTILRPGKIGKEEIEAILNISVQTSTSKAENNTPKSPGQKYSHYKPKASIRYGEISSIEKNTLYLVQNSFQESKNIISYNGDLALLSKELYDRFRQADLEGYTTVFIEKLDSFEKKFPSFYLALLNRISKATQ
ncbi:MAG TPA: L-threonylcarbamoyladenylate synthase [Gracilimonas sp.]|uniref:L-threonylcarbamoyladenylate synthase n=1 Tax=Gracilimonas sp. TaxID=1974203 RepID=UPI002D869967|nr:L-threonylcarbamoyladenylate synthase [Gracilimonas sp.]